MLTVPAWNAVRSGIASERELNLRMYEMAFAPAIGSIGSIGSINSLPIPSPAVRPHGTRFRCSLATQKDTILSWNVNSLRALLRKRATVLKDLVREEGASVLCLQETKVREELEVQIGNVVDPHWFCVYNSSTGRLGYSGTAIFSERYFPTCQRYIGDPLGDSHGRCTTIELDNVFVVTVYTMNSGENLARLPQRMVWDSVFRQHIRMLRGLNKAVIVVGDLNVARNELDVWNPEYYTGRSCFSEVERESFEETLETCGLVDIYRTTNQLEEKYTAWGHRSESRSSNQGIRIDYALVTDDMVDAVKEVRILDHVVGSDHVPIALDLKKGML